MKSVLLFIFLLHSTQILAAEIHIAVASNFAKTASALVETFGKKHSHEIVMSFGSTGKHFAQIRHGAPFDAFFAADTERPERLEREGFAVSGTRFTYAVGQLVLWSPRKLTKTNGIELLAGGEFRFLALANPRLAPYGKAAREVLMDHKLWNKLQGRLVFGENVAQAFQYVSSGNAQLGFVAYSQVRLLSPSERGFVWLVPKHLYTPIRQQAVQLRDGDAARSFLAFVRSDEGKRIIYHYGYTTEQD